MFLVHYFRSAFCHVGNPTIEPKRLLLCVIFHETESSVISNANGIFKILLKSTDRNKVAFMCSKHQVKPFYTQQNNCQLPAHHSQNNSYNHAHSTQPSHMLVNLAFATIRQTTVTTSLYSYIYSSDHPNFNWIIVRPCQHHHHHHH